MHKLKHTQFMVLLVGSLFQPAYAATITVSSNWANCALQDTVANAGDYYATTLQSDSSLLSCTNSYLNISGANPSTTTWTVNSRLITNVNGIGIELIRTGNGAGDVSPVGGRSYTALSTAYQPIFTGQGNRINIPLHFRINNFDVTDGSGNKSFQIEYQVTTN